MAIRATIQDEEFLSLKDWKSQSSWMVNQAAKADSDLSASAMRQKSGFSKKDVSIALLELGVQVAPSRIKTYECGDIHKVSKDVERDLKMICLVTGVAYFPYRRAVKREFLKKKGWR